MQGFDHPNMVNPISGYPTSGLRSRALGFKVGHRPDTLPVQESEKTREILRRRVEGKPSHPLRQLERTVTALDPDAVRGDRPLSGTQIPAFACHFPERNLATTVPLLDSIRSSPLT